MPLETRPMHPADMEPLRAILNDIIAAGGTTAHERPFSAEQFGAAYYHGPTHAAGFTVLDEHGQPAGFQHLGRDPNLPTGWLSIGTFTRRNPRLPGAGRALFAASRAWCEANGIEAIDATIRADNTGGLAFYSSMGFQDYRVYPGVPLKDGTPVDRIAKVFRLGDPENA